MNRILSFVTGTTGLAIVTAIAVLSTLVRIVVGPGADYAAIFPPPWLGLVAAALVVPVIVFGARGSARAPRFWEWAAAVVFLGASGGFILDAFRMFFAITGLPAGEFAVVDLPGAVSRGADLLAALIVILHARRRTTAASSRTAGRMLIWLAVLFAVPYPLLKILWWVQGTSAPYDVGFPAGEIVAFAAATIWVVMLVRITRASIWSWLVICCGLAGSAALLSMGALMIFGLIFQAVAPSGMVSFDQDEGTLLVFGVYSTWLGLGAVMLGATLTAMETVMRVRTEPQLLRA